MKISPHKIMVTLVYLLSLAIVYWGAPPADRTFNLWVWGIAAGALLAYLLRLEYIHCPRCGRETSIPHLQHPPLVWRRRYIHCRCSAILDRMKGGAEIGYMPPALRRPLRDLMRKKRRRQ